MSAMEISVERNNKTGKIQVVSTLDISPETIQERGLKVYDDGQKSVYALHQAGSKNLAKDIKQMTLEDLKELLHQATDMKMVAAVQYHQPVYSILYTGSSKPSSPKTTTETPRQTLTPSPDPLCETTVSSPQINREETKQIQDMKGWITPSKTPSHNFTQESVSRYVEDAKIPYLYLARLSNSDRHHVSDLRFSEITPHGLTKSKTNSQCPASLVSVKARSEGIPLSVLLVGKAVDSSGSLVDSHTSKVNPHTLKDSSSNFNRSLPFYGESITSYNLASTLPEGQQSEPITMIFMGYEKAVAEEEDNIQAELVIIGNSDDGDDETKYVKNETDREDCLSYHPEGYKSKIFQPKVNKAIPGCTDIIEDIYTKSNDLRPHQPTFLHNPGKHRPYLQGQV